MLDFDNAKGVLNLTEKGEPVAYDLQFQDGVAVSETIHANIGNDVHVYVGLDQDGTPVAISLVHPPLAVKYTKATVDAACRRGGKSRERRA